MDVQPVTEPAPGAAGANMVLWALRSTIAAIHNAETELQELTQQDAELARQYAAAERAARRQAASAQATHQRRLQVVRACRSCVVVVHFRSLTAQPPKSRSFGSFAKTSGSGKSSWRKRWPRCSRRAGCRRHPWPARPRPARVARPPCSRAPMSRRSSRLSSPRPALASRWPHAARSARRSTTRRRARATKGRTETGTAEWAGRDRLCRAAPAQDQRQSGRRKRAREAIVAAAVVVVQLLLLMMLLLPVLPLLQLCLRREPVASASNRLGGRQGGGGVRHWMEDHSVSVYRMIWQTWMGGCWMIWTARGPSRAAGCGLRGATVQRRPPRPARPVQPSGPSSSASALLD